MAGKSIWWCVDPPGRKPFPQLIRSCTPGPLSRQLQEFGSKYESETLRSSRRLEAADVIIYVFDSSDPNSFSYVSNLRQQYALDDVPSIFVATKSDLDLAQQVSPSLPPRVRCFRS